MHLHPCNLLIYFQNGEEIVWGEGDLQEILLVSLFFFLIIEKSY